MVVGWVVRVLFHEFVVICSIVPAFSVLIGLGVIVAYRVAVSCVTRVRGFWVHFCVSHFQVFFFNATPLSLTVVGDVGICLP